jgi:hypothetical protein
MPFHELVKQEIVEVIDIFIPTLGVVAIIYLSIIIKGKSKK